MRVFITGGTTGIGLELAKVYLDKGATVGVCGRDESKLPENLKNHWRLKFFSIDVKSRERVLEVLVEFCREGIDLVIANAGKGMEVKGKIPNFERSKDVIDINILGVLYTAEACLPKMLKQKKGHFVAISSVSGFMGLPGASSYCASKAAVTTLMESYDLDLSPQGLNFTTICPGFIDTPLTQKNHHPMPFLMSASKAAEKISKAIEKKKTLYIFPWQMKLVVIFLNKVPRHIYRFLMKLPMLNYSNN